jgi:hypothetical protein
VQKVLNVPCFESVGNLPTAKTYKTKEERENKMEQGEGEVIVRGIALIIITLMRQKKFTAL